MRIKKLFIKRFGRISDMTIEPENGINVIYGSNESGKSTIAFFIFAMIFGMEENDKSGMHARYCPWENESEFGGSIEFEQYGVFYRITRFFSPGAKSVSLENLSTGRELYPAERVLGELFPGLNKREYVNTYFCFEGTEKPAVSIVGDMKRRSMIKSDMNNGSVDTDYALHVLDERRRGLSDPGYTKRLKELEEIIDREEKTEKSLDEIAARELVGRTRAEELNKELDKYLTLSLFEEKEQEYYQCKERYHIYKKDIELSHNLSEQLEKTVRIREELESNSAKMERCKEELASVRMFKKKNKEMSTKTRQEIESMGQLLLTESRSNMNARIALLMFAIVLIVIGIVTLFEQLTPFYNILMFAGAFVFILLFCVNTMRWNKKKRQDKEKLKNLRELLKDYSNEYELYFRAHSSEEELVSRYEEYLKENGRIPGIIEKETELSEQLEKLEEDLAIRDRELTEFFRQFGIVEDLKDDELVIQEKNLRDAKESRILKAEELKAEITALNESMIKMHMQVEAGEENEINLLKHREERAGLLEKQKEVNRKIKSIELAIKIIETLSTEEADGFGNEINQKASGYAAAFTGNHYTSFVADENLDCKVDYYDKFISVKELSNGAEEQLNLALRLSVGDVLLRDFELPLIFDDAFVYYDDERLAGTLAEICKRSEQIFIFTCQNREETILDQLNQEHFTINI